MLLLLLPLLVPVSLASAVSAASRHAAKRAGFTSPGTAQSASQPVLTSLAHSANDAAGAEGTACNAADCARTPACCCRRGSALASMGSELQEPLCCCCCILLPPPSSQPMSSAPTGGSCSRGPAMCSCCKECMITLPLLWWPVLTVVDSGLSCVCSIIACRTAPVTLMVAHTTASLLLYRPTYSHRQTAQF
jgi:hypothetical protein